MAELIDTVVHKHQILTEQEWDSQFTLIPNSLVENASFDGYMFETYGAELDKVMQTPPNFVWTYQDDDNGNPCITSGFHLVNRIGYLISQNPWEIDTFVHLDLETEDDLNDDE